MPTIPRKISYCKNWLASQGINRVISFCGRNDISLPMINDVPSYQWVVDACAFYRPDTEGNKKRGYAGINICLNKCASPATEEQVRNWNWPGSTTDREPFGVLCHELGHHCDWVTGEKKWTYGSEYCQQVMSDSGEPPITSYAENPAEWFAEMFRLFVTNHALLLLLRPKTWKLLTERFQPVSSNDWEYELGSNVPKRILNNLKKKIIEAKK